MSKPASGRSQQQMQQRVQSALGHPAIPSAATVSAAYQTLPPRPAVALGLDPLPAFCLRLCLNRGLLDVAPTGNAATQLIAQRLQQLQLPAQIITGACPRLQQLPWAEAGIEVAAKVTAGHDSVAVSYAQFGVAETGAAVVYSGAENPSLNNWLVQHHIVLLDAAEVLAQLEDGWQRIRQDSAGQQLPGGIYWLSGPSSTADVVGHMVYGAHGPVSWQLVLIGDIDPDLPATSLRLANQLLGVA